MTGEAVFGEAGGGVDVDLTGCAEGSGDALGSEAEDAALTLVGPLPLPCN